jgi:hypothetical protein
VRWWVMRTIKDGSQNLVLEAREAERLWSELRYARVYQQRAYAAVAYANEQVRELEIKLGLRIRFEL